MEQDLVAEFRKLLEELVIPELRAIASKIDEISQQMAAFQKQTNAQTEAIWAEIAKAREFLPEPPVQKQRID